MRNVLQRCRRKYGSVLIVVIAVFVVLIIFLASFMKSTTSRTHSTKKIGDTMLARELANSLAVASFHYIKNIELKNEGSELIKVLSEPMPFSNDNKVTGDLVGGMKASVKDGETDIISSLLDKSGLESIKLEEMTWTVHKGDFAPLQLNGKDSIYPREKRGLIRVFIKLSYKLPGQKDSISEDYLFASVINVSANLIPVLSKFNFYVEDAYGGNTPGSEEELLYRFNLVHTSAGGKLQSNSKHCPWIFQNGAKDEYPNSYKKMVESKKGFIYLGGGSKDKPIVLGIARGFSGMTSGPYGEDFHFYKKGTSGYWKTREVWKPGEGILSANIGLCDEESSTDPNLMTWQLMFGEGYKKQSLVNSIFRLYGTDQTEQSPTVVLGFVNSMSGDVRAYKGPSGSNKLAFFDKPEDFVSHTTLCSDLDTTDYGYYHMGYALQSDIAINKFALAYQQNFGLQQDYNSLEQFYEKYKKEYSTQVIQVRYNRDYSYIFAQHEGAGDDALAYPLDSPNLINDDMVPLCELKDNDVFTKIPTSDKAEFNKIYNTDKLDKLDPFLDVEKLCIDNSEDSDEKPENRYRIANVFKYAKDDITLEDYLRFKYLLKKDETGSEKLDLNGWLYIECDSSEETIEIDKYNSISQGGFIIGNKSGGKAHIRIKGNIDGSHLTIIVLNGDIKIDYGVTKINASLIAGNGQVILDCGTNTDITRNSDLTVNGNIVMKELTETNINDSFKRCLTLNYDENLAAVPNKDRTDIAQDMTEFAVLMYDLKEDVLMLD